MAAEKIKILIKEPGKEARVEEIEDDWRVYGKLVGGLMETIPMPGIKNAIAVINEEGKLVGLEPNIYLPENEDMLVGTMVVVGDARNGEFKSLTDDQIEKAKAYIAANDASGYTGDIDDYNKVEFFTFKSDEDFLKALFGESKKSGSEM